MLSATSGDCSIRGNPSRDQGHHLALKLPKVDGFTWIKGVLKEFSLHSLSRPTTQSHTDRTHSVAEDKPATVQSCACGEGIAPVGVNGLPSEACRLEVTPHNTTNTLQAFVEG